jgi:excisionase family DNA binding protein
MTTISTNESIDNTSMVKLENDITAIKNEYLNTDELMDLLGVSRQTIHNWTCSKKIAYYKFGKTLKFHINDIKAFIESTKQEAVKAG